MQILLPKKSMLEQFFLSWNQDLFLLSIYMEMIWQEKKGEEPEATWLKWERGMKAELLKLLNQAPSCDFSVGNN